MGAWGAGSFENDTAMDWTYEVKSARDVSKPFERLKKETDVHPDQGDMEIEADFASELIAAAETVAMMMGRKIPGFPEELEAAVGGEQDVSELLYHQARNAVLCVLRNSELAELWEEAAEDTGENEWNVEITALIDRLNPDVEYTPLTPEEIQVFVGEILDPCVFCNQPVAQDERFAMTLHDTKSLERLRPSLAMHIDCFNKRAHHKHVWHDMRHKLEDFDFDMSKL